MMAMINSSGWDQFVNALFDWCVHTLIVGAHYLGISYNEINIWVFCIIEPIIFILMLVLIIWQWIRLRRLNKRSVITSM